MTKESHRCKHCPNFASLELVLNRNTGLQLFTSKANESSVRYSVSKSYFTNIAVQNVNCIKKCNTSLKFKRHFQISLFLKKSFSKNDPPPFSSEFYRA